MIFYVCVSLQIMEKKSLLQMKEKENIINIAHKAYDGKIENTKIYENECAYIEN